MIKVHNIHVWKCHNETHYFVQLIYINKKLKKSLKMSIFRKPSKCEFECGVRKTLSIVRSIWTDNWIVVTCLFSG
jgi:hypothetical protein